MNERVLITGASSGIGRALAYEFARQGFDLLLLARDSEKLKEIQNSVSAMFGIHCESAAIDLTKEDEVKNFFDSFDDAWRNTSVLVNNAGIGCHGSFDQTSLETEVELIKVQLVAMLQMTKFFFGFRDARHQKLRIVNVASVYSFLPVPYQAVYAACKAFLYSFAEALRHEKHTNLDIINVFPGSTKTSFRLRMAGYQRKENDSGMEPEAVARIVVKGVLKNKRMIIPGLLNKAFVITTRILPMHLGVKILLAINERRQMNRR